MQSIDLDEIYNNFNDKCFELCQNEYFHDEEEFIDNVLGETFKYLLMPVYGDDEETIDRRVREYLSGFVYRDPSTNIAKTFVEWSHFFNTDDWYDRFDEVYEACGELSDENFVLRKQIAELKQQLQQKNNEHQNNTSNDNDDMEPIVYGKYQYSAELDAFMFPVGLHHVYFDREKARTKIIPPIPYYPAPSDKFLAVVDEERWHMIEAVSKSYTLITNRIACEYGLRISKKIFGFEDDNLYEFWHGEMTKDRGSCSMTFKYHKDINISGIENHWLAYIEIGNSYDCSATLSYNIGFSLETMSGREMPIGILVPSLAVQFSGNHNWKLNTILNKLIEAVDKQFGGRNVFAEFERMVRELCEITMVDDEILPLFCKLVGLTKEDADKPWAKYLAHVLINIDKNAAKWIESCGCNAYAALCTYADFISFHTKDISMLIPNPSQYESLLGQLMDDLIVAYNKDKKNFSLDKFIGHDAREAKKWIKLMSR